MYSYLFEIKFYMLPQWFSVTANITSIFPGGHLAISWNTVSCHVEGWVLLLVSNGSGQAYFPWCSRQIGYIPTTKYVTPNVNGAEVGKPSTRPFPTLGVFYELEYEKSILQQGLEESFSIPSSLHTYLNLPGC